MDNTTTAALLTILRQKLVPATQLAEVAEEHGDADRLLHELLDDVGGRELFPAEPALDVEGELDAARRDLDAWQDEGIRVVNVFDAQYPLNLRSVHDRPALLLIRGEIERRDETAVAVVGTRKASTEGLARATKLATQLVEAGHVVVSGLAAGIDTAAHTGAMQAGGRTVAVIGTGHRHSFPKPNTQLQQHLSETSAVISQFWPDQGPRPWTFPLRNAVMSGFALATVVVEASYTSGARIQARLALEHGRPVFMLQSLVDMHDWAKKYAERPGVYVISSTDEVVDKLSRLYPSELVAAS
jgi:DNA processing protein